LAYSNRDFRVCSRAGLKEQNGGMNWGNRVVDYPNAKRNQTRRFGGNE
jgi:hypothetical protein